MQNMIEKKRPKGIAILGSTGNIGVQALEIISQNRDLFSIKLLTAHSNIKLLIEQIKIFQPELVYMSDKDKTKELKQLLSNHDIAVLETTKDLYQSFYDDSLDLVFLAMVGFAGLMPAMEVIKAKKTLALANKESLVAGGDILMREAKNNQVEIIPVDSEHSAIFQCLVGEAPSSVEKLILTASGGPFLGFSEQQLKEIQPKDALKHPKWQMGP